MGYAERQNPHSMKNRKANERLVAAPAQVLKVSTRENGEPVVVELSIKTVFHLLKDKISKWLNPLRPPLPSQSPAPIS